MSTPEVRPIAPNASAIGRGDSAIVVGVSSNKTGPTPENAVDGDPAKNGPQPQTTAATPAPDQYKTEFIKVYQDAGVVGLAMLTLLVLCLLMGWFSARILKMYIAMIDAREKSEAIRLQYFDKLTNAVIQVSADVKQVLTDLRSDHTEHGNKLTEAVTILQGLSQRLDNIAFRQKGDPK